MRPNRHRSEGRAVRVQVAARREENYARRKYGSEQTDTLTSGGARSFLRGCRAKSRWKGKCAKRDRRDQNLVETSHRISKQPTTHPKLSTPNRSPIDACTEN